MPIVGTMWVCDICAAEIGFAEPDKVCFVSYQHPRGRGTSIFCLKHADEAMKALGVTLADQ